MSNSTANYGQSKTPSKASSDGSPIKEETFIESIKSQVDSGNIEDIIRGQKRALERFEKTNEMLANCCTLAEKRLEKARKDFATNKEQILQAKSDLDSIFRRILHFKKAIANECAADNQQSKQVNLTISRGMMDTNKNDEKK